MVELAVVSFSLNINSGTGSQTNVSEVSAPIKIRDRSFGDDPSASTNFFPFFTKLQLTNGHKLMKRCSYESNIARIHRLRSLRTCNGLPVGTTSTHNSRPWGLARESIRMNHLRSR